MDDDPYFAKGSDEGNRRLAAALMCLAWSLAFVAAVAGFCFLAWCRPQLAEGIARVGGLLIGVAVVLFFAR